MPRFSTLAATRVGRLQIVALVAFVGALGLGILAYASVRSETQREAHCRLFDELGVEPPPVREQSRKWLSRYGADASVPIGRMLADYCTPRSNPYDIPALVLLVVAITGAVAAWIMKEPREISQRA